jgi:hypothetical protein
MEDMQLRFK